MNTADLLEHLRGLDLYAVTCDDSHVVLGPINGYEDAAAFAADLSDDEGSGCLYRVVPFALIIDQNKMDEVARMISPLHPLQEEGRGYL